MIESKEDYKFYLEADRLALGVDHRRPRLFGDEIWKFERLLRKAEYLQNCRKDLFSRIYFAYVRYELYKMNLAFGYCIPRNVFGPGLSIAYYSGPIVVNINAKVGANCRISQCVTIGGEECTGEKNGAPKIGDNVFIGPGAVIVGAIEIADNIAIGANAFVNKSFKEPGITIAGVPARKISDEGSTRLINRVTETLKKRIDSERK